MLNMNLQLFGGNGSSSAVASANNSFNVRGFDKQINSYIDDVELGGANSQNTKLGDVSLLNNNYDFKITENYSGDEKKAIYSDANYTVCIEYKRSYNKFEKYSRYYYASKSKQYIHYTVYDKSGNYVQGKTIYQIETGSNTIAKRANSKAEKIWEALTKRRK